LFVLEFWASLLVRIVAARQERRRRAAQMVAGCGTAPTAGLHRDPVRLYTIMSEFNIQGFRAPAVIMGTFGPHLVISARDHETA
jgi:hypothetical protein